MVHYFNNKYLLGNMQYHKVILLGIIKKHKLYITMN